LLLHTIFSDINENAISSQYKNPKCKLLDIIFIDINCKETHQELSRKGIKPVNKVWNAKIRLIAMFYGIDIKYVVNELNIEIIVDPTDIRFKINLDKKFYDDRILEENGCEFGFSSSKGKFIGGKLTIAMDYDTCQPLTMLFHPGAVHDSKIYLEILADLKRRRILKKGELILADKGYFSFKNYGAGLMDYKIVPLIRPKKDTRKDRVFSQFNYPL